MGIGRFGKLGSVAAISFMLCVSPAALAKKEPKDSVTEVAMADAFRTDARAARVALGSGDMGGANARIASLQPANPLEKYVAGSLRYEYASRRNDPQAIRRALTDMLESGAAPDTLVPYLRYLAGYYSYYLGEHADAIAQVNYARQLGYTSVETTILLADATLKKGKRNEGFALVQQAITQQRASGQPVPEAWFDRAASLAYQAKDWPELAKWYEQKLETYPSAANWRTSLTNYLTGAGLDPQVQLDLYRLQSATGAMASERDFLAYATLAAKSGYEAEAKAIIESARANGKLTPSELGTATLLKSVSPKAARDIAALPAQASKAAAASSGTAAATAGDAYSALGQYPQAAAQYRLALSKGGVDAARVNARLGIALARSGDLPGAKAALAQVTGTWSVVAAFWTVWVNEQAKRSLAVLIAAPLPLG